jgi:hypothetical protein
MISLEGKVQREKQLWENLCVFQKYDFRNVLKLTCFQHLFIRNN